LEKVSDSIGFGIGFISYVAQRANRYIVAFRIVIGKGKGKRAFV